MQLLTTGQINSRYTQGVNYLTNISYNEFVKDQYSIQYKKTADGIKALLLLHAINDWDNRPGASNTMSQKQMLSILDQLNYLNRNPDASQCTATSSSYDSSLTFSVEDTDSIHLSFINGILKASLIVSPDADNILEVVGNGVYASESIPNTKIYFTDTNFDPGTNTYRNVALAGKTNFIVWNRGLGFLIYDFANSTDPNNEYTILPGGGITITIPGYDVHSSTNFFYILY